MLAPVFDEETGEEYPIIESGRNWAIAQTPYGFFRRLEGQEPRLFDSLDAALTDCGVAP